MVHRIVMVGGADATRRGDRRSHHHIWLCRPNVPDPNGPRLLSPNPRTLTICESTAPRTVTRVYRYHSPETDITRTYNDLVKHQPTGRCPDNGFLGPEHKLVVRLGYPNGRTAVLSGVRGADDCLQGPGGVLLAGHRAAEVWGEYTNLLIGRV